MNRKLEYSLMALKHMSRKKAGELTSAKEVSDSYQTPFDATARVMQLMAQNGILKSEQGVNGGYLITKDLSQVTLQELIDVVQGPTPIAKCIHHKANRPGKSSQQEEQQEPCELLKSCNIISPIQALNQKLSEFYQNLTLKELLVK